MAKNNSTKAKTEPAAEEQQEGITAPAAEEQQESTPTLATNEGQQENTPTLAATEGQQEGVTTPIPEDEPFAGTHVVNTARGLNLREAPSYGAPVVEILPFGTTVQAIDPEGAPAGWVFVMTEANKSGFVAARYVNPVEE